MTDSPLRETPPPGRGRRSLAGLRYVPLIVLLLGVIAATVVGWQENRAADDTAKKGSGQPAAPIAQPSLPKVCAPAVDQGLTAEPWRGALKKTSEATFARRIAEEEPGYVAGRDGWKFFTDVQTKDFSQAIGRVRLTKTPVEKWADYLVQMQREAESRGGKFYVMIAPAKWDVYPEKLPGWAQKLRGTNSLDSLMSAHPELPFIDVRQPLRKAARTESTYSPLDSHWTGYGGYVAWKAATACLRADGGDGALDVPAIEGVERVADRNEHEADGVKPSVEPPWTIPVYAQPHPATTVTNVTTGDPVEIGSDHTVDMLLLPVETRTREAQTDETLLALRDSTGTSLSPLWSSSFARTVQYQHPVGGLADPVDIKQLVDEHRPDITIFTMTQRYLAYGPPSATTAP